MRIAMNQTGGLFPRDRHVEIRGDRIEVTDQPLGQSKQGTQRHTAKLAGEDVARLHELATRVAIGGDQIDTESSGVDGGQTVLEIDDGAVKSRVEIRRGRSTGQEVWDLLDAVEGLAATGEG